MLELVVMPFVEAVLDGSFVGMKLAGRVVCAGAIAFVGLVVSWSAERIGEVVVDSLATLVG